MARKPRKQARRKAAKGDSLPEGVGIDVIDIARFKPLCGDRTHHFLVRVFTRRELNYCFGYKDPAPHLAGTFAAKEAASKALGAKKNSFIELEVRHDRAGAPHIWKKGRRLAIALSITHTKDIAAAFAVR